MVYTGQENSAQDNPHFRSVLNSCKIAKGFTSVIPDLKAESNNDYGYLTTNNALRALVGNDSNCSYFLVRFLEMRYRMQYLMDRRCKSGMLANANLDSHTVSILGMLVKIRS